MLFNIWKSPQTGCCYPAPTDIIYGFDWQLVATITADSIYDAMDIAISQKF